MTERLPVPEAWGMLFAAPLPEAQKRCHHELAHGLLREKLPEYGSSRNITTYDEPPRLAFGKNGKPTLADYPEIHFNLSHCEGLAVCLFSPYECGADCENIRKFKQRTAERVCSAEELAALDKAQDKDYLFTRLWTLKEAYVKAIGIGISYPLREVSFAFENDRIIASKQEASFQQLLLKEHIVSVCVLHPMPEQRVVTIA